MRRTSKRKIWAMKMTRKKMTTTSSISISSNNSTTRRARISPRSMRAPMKMRKTRMKTNRMMRTTMGKKRRRSRI